MSHAWEMLGGVVREKERSESRGPVSSCCSGSVGQRHAARAHMESRLNSSADSNCPSVVYLEKHVLRQCRLAAWARSPSKKEALHKPPVMVQIFPLAQTSASTSV